MTVTHYNPIFTHGRITPLDKEFHVDVTTETSLQFEALVSQIEDPSFAKYMVELRVYGERREVFDEVEATGTFKAVSMPLIVATEQIEVAHTTGEMPLATDTRPSARIPAPTDAELAETDRHMTNVIGIWDEAGNKLWTDESHLKESSRDRRYLIRQGRRDARRLLRATLRVKVHRVLAKPVVATFRSIRGAYKYITRDWYSL